MKRRILINSSAIYENIPQRNLQTRTVNARKKRKNNVCFEILICLTLFLTFKINTEFSNLLLYNLCSE